MFATHHGLPDALTSIGEPIRKLFHADARLLEQHLLILVRRIRVFDVLAGEHPSFKDGDSVRRQLATGLLGGLRLVLVGV